MQKESISLTKLSKLTGRHLVHLSRLVHDGLLPVGFTVGKTRYVPKQESLLAISKLRRRKRKPSVILDTLDDLLA